MANDLSFQANIAIFESVGFFFAQVRDHVIKYFPFECLHDWRLPVALTHNRLLSLSRPFLFLLLAPLYWVCVCVCAVYCVLICFCSIDKLRISIVVFCNCASRNGILLELKRDPFRYNNCTFVNFRLFTNWRIEFDPIRLRSEGCSTHFKREREIKKKWWISKGKYPSLNQYLSLSANCTMPLDLIESNRIAFSSWKFNHSVLNPKFLSFRWAEFDLRMFAFSIVQNSIKYWNGRFFLAATL